MGLEENLVKKILELVEQKASEQHLDEEEVTKIIEKGVKGSWKDGVEQASSIVADTLRQQIPEMLTQEQASQTGFERRLYDRWKKALDLYYATIILCRECGELFVKQHIAQSAKDKDHVFGVLMHIHPRACQTALGVGVLLKSGFARDALARQRTLHELAASASFIKKHGEETAERYWLHNTIESYKAALQYEQYCKRLGYKPYDPAELDLLQAQRDALIIRFGTVFSEDYGWAAQALGKTARLTFADIERDVHLDHLRPYYRIASHLVHANAKGLVFDIGNMYKSIPGYHRTLLAGASNAGLADPGQLALISFNQCTAVFLTLKSNLETLMKLSIPDTFLHKSAQPFI